MYYPKRWFHGLFVLALLALAACTASQPEAVYETDPTAPVISGGQTDLASLPATADLPPLPRLQSNGGPGGGMGGGGGGGEGIPSFVVSEVASEMAEGGYAAEEPGMMDMKMAYYSVFSGTQFVLNTSLPTAPTQAIVHIAPEYTLTLEQATAWATQFGFPTPLYQEVFGPDFYQYAPRGEMRMPYFTFMGKKQLTLSGYGVFYYDAAVIENYPSQVDYAQSAPIAEALLRQWGLLNFPYVLEEGYNGDVLVKRIVEGEPLNYGEIYVHFNNQYEVVYVNYNPIIGLQPVGQYPLITAEAAWQQIQAGLDSMDTPYDIMPSDEPVEPYEDPYANEYKYWQRAYTPGQPMRGYGGVMAYRTVDGNTPMVRFAQYQVVGDTAELNRLVDSIGGQITIEGVISDDGLSINLTGWQVQQEYWETLYLEGVVNASDQPNSLLFTTIDGQNYLLPDAPADLELGTEVYVFAWASRDTGAPYPVLDWQGIDKKVYYNYNEAFEDVSSEGEMSIMPIEPGFGFYFAYTNITFDKVELTYYYMPQWSAYPQDGSMPAFDIPPVVLQPVWKFSGTAETNNDYTERIAIYIQAVDPNFVRE